MSFVPFSGEGQRLGDPPGPSADLVAYLTCQVPHELPGTKHDDAEMVHDNTTWNKFPKCVKEQYDTLQDIKTMVASWDVELQDHEYTKDIKEGVSELAFDVVMATSAYRRHVGGRVQPETSCSDLDLPTTDEVLDLCRRFDKMKPLVQELIKNQEVRQEVQEVEAGPKPGRPGPGVADAFEKPAGKKRKVEKALRRSR